MYALLLLLRDLGIGIFFVVVVGLFDDKSSDHFSINKTFRCCSQILLNSITITKPYVMRTFYTLFTMVPSTLDAINLNIAGPQRVVYNQSQSKHSAILLLLLLLLSLLCSACVLPAKGFEESVYLT